MHLISSKNLQACFGIGLTASLAGMACCGGKSEIKCSTGSLNRTLPDTPLTQMPHVEVLDAGGQMALIGSEGDWVRWALISGDGTLGPEQSFPLPAGRLEGPYFALTGKDGVANQAVAVFKIPDAADPTVTHIAAVAQGAPGMATAPVALFSGPAGAPADALKFAVGSSSSGAVAGVVYGFQQMGAPLSFVTLGVDAQPKGAPKDVRGVPDNWTCLGVVKAYQANLGVAFLDPGTEQDASSSLSVLQANDDGSTSTLHAPPIPRAQMPADCPVIIPKDDGYWIAQRSDAAVSLVDYDIMRGGKIFPFLAGNEIQFGTPIPQVAGLAAYGVRVALLMARSTGPYVIFFDYLGGSVGNNLNLPVTANLTAADDVSSVSRQNVMFATYREKSAAFPKGQRRFVGVTCSVD